MHGYKLNALKPEKHIITVYIMITAHKQCFYTSYDTSTVLIFDDIMKDQFLMPISDI